MSFSMTGKRKTTKKRLGQTAVEYILVTVSLLFVFTTMYKSLQYAVAKQFENGGKIIMKVYIEDYN